MRIKVLRNTMATGRPLTAGTLVDVSKQDAASLIQMGKALPAGGDDPAAVENREKDLASMTRDADAPESAKAMSIETSLICPDCGKVYKMKQHFERHLKTVHGKDPE